jgi:hypothetical protein
MRHLASRGVLAALTAFLALTTIVGATLVVPTLPLEWLEGSVFSDYTIPALALAFVGGLSLVALGTVVFRAEIAGGVAIAAGVAMVAFEIVEIWVVGLSLIEYGADEPVAWLQIVYISLGMVTAAAGLWLWRNTAGDRERQTRTSARAVA